MPTTSMSLRPNRSDNQAATGSTTRNVRIVTVVMLSATARGSVVVCDTQVAA